MKQNNGIDQKQVRISEASADETSEHKRKPDLTEGLRRLSWAVALSLFVIGLFVNEAKIRSAEDLPWALLGCLIVSGLGFGAIRLVAWVLTGFYGRR